VADAYLLDTSIASIAWDGENRNHGFVRTRIAALGEDAISVCSISIGEVEYGLRVSQAVDPARHLSARQAMLTYKIWDIDRFTGEVYGIIRSALFEQHAPRDKRGRLTKKRPEDLRETTTARELGIQENDLWIVSVAIQYDLNLISRDGKMRRILDAATSTGLQPRGDIWSLPDGS
jgi:predicted nucleic acid-binding protein